MKNFIGNGLAEPASKMYITLRVASAMCFIGHGVFGIITKQVWCNYFAVFGISQDMAYRLMPVVGTMDIALGLTLLLYPLRIVPLWLVFWGLLTALLRPLSGESFAEMIERAGNYGAPLSLLLLAGMNRRGLLGGSRPGLSAQAPDGAAPGGPVTASGASSVTAPGGPVTAGSSAQGGWFRGLWTPVGKPHPDARAMANTLLCLRIAVFLLLLGHGWLNLIEKKGLLQQYAGLGFSAPVKTAFFVGLFEILAAAAVLVRPVRPLLLALFIWKMGTELFYPHWGIFEWIERGGSYGCLLALFFGLEKNFAVKTTNVSIQN